jgi:acetyl-CoA C-acetyltransferase
MPIGGQVAIIGVGKTKFGENFDQRFSDMVVDAAFQAYADAGISPDEVDAGWLGTAFAYTFSDEGNAGASLAEPLGLYPKPVSRVANYCATGMDAARHAAMAVAAGECEIALVVGAEKMRDVGPRQSLLAQHVERGHPVYAKGRTAPGMFGLIANRYKHLFVDPRPAMTAVALKNHYNGSLNPFAHFQKPLTEQEVLKAPLVSGALRLYDCCPTTDGAAAMILCSIDRAKALRPHDYVVIQALELASTTGYFSAQYDLNNDFLGFSATRAAARKAYEVAGVRSAAAEVRVAEVHDCFTVTEVINYEDLGFCEKGEGHRFVLDGRANIDGTNPFNTSGGLQSCGHPIGATGARVMVDVVEQIRGQAGRRQVRDPVLGLCHTLGGPGSVACVGLLSEKDWRGRR